MLGIVGSLAAMAALYSPGDRARFMYQLSDAARFVWLRVQAVVLPVTSHERKPGFFRCS